MDPEIIDTTPPADGVSVDPADASVSPDVAADSSPADVNERESSPPVDSVESKRTLLDVARDVLAKSRPEPEPAADPGSPPKDSPRIEERSETPTPAALEASEPADDDFRDADQLPFGKHPRFKKLLAQLAQDRDPAKQFRQVQMFLDQNGVSPGLAADGLKQAALLQHARRGSAEHARLFLKDIDALRNEVRQLLGEEIPEDLREKVDNGLIDEGSAKELAQSRSRLQLTERQREEDQQERAARTQAETRKTAQDAVATWESQVRTRDPDYERKAPLLLRAAKALAAEHGAPRTPEEAVKLAQEAYADVNRSIQSLLPRPRNQAPTTPRGQQGGPPQATPQPKTLLDAVRLAAARG